MGHRTSRVRVAGRAGDQKAKVRKRFGGSPSLQSRRNVVVECRNVGRWLLRRLDVRRRRIHDVFLYKRDSRRRDRGDAEIGA
jgi:hypothetical protein